MGGLKGMRATKINSTKVKIFERKDLIEKLNFTEDEAKIIMKYQRTFPELLQDIKGFVIDGETLCNSLGVKDHFTKWLLGNRIDNEGNVKSQGKLIKYRMIENIDYHLGESPTVAKGTPKKIITLTLQCAKKIAMRQNNKMGDLVCDYFILMERALRDYEHWTMIRNPEKESYRKLCDVLNENYKLTHEGKEANNYIYSNEADMINRALLGESAKNINKLLENEDKVTREHFNIEINRTLNELQTMDMALVMAGLSFEARQKTINNICNTKYAGISLKIKELKEAL